MNWSELIREVGRGTRGARDLDAATAEKLMGAMLDRQVPDMELGALLLSMRIKGESPQELAGFHAAMQARTARLDLPAGPRCVLLPSFNGARKTANLMPLVALLLARERVPVLIFGRHDFDSRISPFALLDALGLPTADSLQQAQTQLAAQRLAVLPLQALNPGLDALMALRPRLGVRNSGHSLAKLLDPGPGRCVRVVAVTHPEYLDSMSTLLPTISLASPSLLMRACEGEAFAHPRRRPHLVGFTGGQAQPLHDPEAPEEDVLLLPEIEPAANAAVVRRMADGDLPVPRRVTEQVQALIKLAYS